MDLVDERDDHAGRLGVQIEVGHEFGKQLRPRDVGLGEGEPPLALGRRQALGGDEAAQPGHRQALDAGDDLGLGIEAAHGTTPLRGS